MGKWLTRRKRIVWGEKRWVWDQQLGYWRELFCTPTFTHHPPRLPVKVIAQERKGKGGSNTCDTLTKCIARVKHRLICFRFRWEKGPPHQRAALWAYPWVGKPVLVWVVKPSVLCLYEKQAGGIQARYRRRRVYRLQRLTERAFPQQADCWIVVLPHGGCLLLPRKALPPWDNIHIRADRGILWKYWERWDLLLTLPDGIPPDLVYRRSAPHPRAFLTQKRWDKLIARRVPSTELTAPQAPSPAHPSAG